MNLRFPPFRVHPCAFRRFVILAAAAAAVSSASNALALPYTYTRTTSNTAGDPDSWEDAEGWDTEPVSSSTTTLNFTGGSSASPIAAGTTIYTTNDKGDFQLNQMNFTQHGPRSGAAPVVTVRGGLLDFVTDGAVLPKLTVGTTYDILASPNNSAVLSRIAVVIENNVKLGASTLVTLGGGSQLGTSSSTVELAGSGITIGALLAAGVSTSGSEPVAQISGQLTGTNGVNFHIGSGSRAATLTINNTANDYAGNTVFTGESSTSTSGSSGSSRTVMLGNSEVIPNGAGKGNVTLFMGTRSTYTLNLNGKSETINGLFSGGQSLNGRIITSTAAATLTLGDNNQAGYFLGQLTGAGFGLTKVGTENQVISGVSSYGGDTIAADGTLTLDFNDYGGATADVPPVAAPPTNHFSPTSKLVLAGGTLAIGGRDAGSDIDKVTTASTTSNRTLALTSTSGVVAGQSVTVFNNSTNAQHATTFVRSVDRVANRVYLQDLSGNPSSATLRLEFAPIASLQTSQTFKGLTLGGTSGVTSELDFGDTAGGVVLNFAELPTQTNNGSILSILNFTGTPQEGGKTDQFRVTFAGNVVEAMDLFMGTFGQNEIVFSNYDPGYELDYTSGNTYFEVVPTVVPEPTALAGIAGVAGLLLARRRRSK